ncbi:FAD:protein FMN transferase [Antarcticimicrobium luteum]|uniref:FAD:protein FMN transferase n=1 Tax=Antarcticimicrobium luteum TaxID=2547397 RepID=A0A4R5UZ03_9RHOB|nr:FAD:protein FMN transferase [Antarcticimicrobium luteum]TDK44481.1 FAD:protein FMN transferase [Antarcticimicrobium luteum]
MTQFSRRRFLTIAAACAAVPARAAPATARWQGRALGAGVSMQLAGLTGPEAAPIFAEVARELERLEAIFSLYQGESEISRLNRDGVLPAPSPEMLELLSLSGALHRATGGAFDPTVQPLWLALAAGNGAGNDIEAARARVGWPGLRFDAAAVRFTTPGMAITLNGIAQGAVTDRIAALLRARGLRDVLVDMGEIAAMGHRADGADWSVGIADPAGRIVRRMTLTDRALATSAPLGTLLDAGTGQGHILNPVGGAPRRALVSVSAPGAALADGLSTALCLLTPARGAEVLAQFPQARLETAI